MPITISSFSSRICHVIILLLPVLVRADLTSDPSIDNIDMGVGVLIGNVRLPWATQFHLDGKDAHSRRGTRCAFSFAYEVFNSAKETVVVKATSVSEDQHAMHQGQPFVLTAGQKKTVAGRIYLSNGVSNLTFRVEAARGDIEKSAAVHLSGC